MNKKCTLIIHDEVNCSVRGLQNQHKDRLKDKYGVLVPTRFYNIKFKLGQWDGKIAFFKDNGDTYFHLLDEIVPYLDDMGYNIDLVDNRISKVCEPDPIDNQYLSHLTFPNGEPVILRDHQVDVINALLAEGVGIGKAATGAGKCLAPDTPIIMADSSVRQIKDINIGDKLLGDDGTFRTVLGKTTGTSPMYKITPKSKGHDTWICNDKHILSLVANCDGGICKKDQVIDIGIDEYVNQTDTFKHITKQYSVGFNGWPPADFPTDPYMIGLWLGDGNTNGPMIWNIDEEVIDYIYEYATQRNMSVTVYEQHNKKTKCCGYNLITEGKKLNPLRKLLKEFVMDNIKFIPEKYITSSVDQRLQLLAGLIDSDGYIDNKRGVGRGVEIAQKSKPLSDAICKIGRSLGFRVSRSEKNINGTTYQTMYISGDLSKLPLKIKRKRQSERNSNKDYLRTGFTVEKLPESEYVGLVVDGNHRFLKSDFTVIHNTIITGCLTKIYEESCDFNTITIVPNKTLVRQTHKDYIWMGLDAGVFYGDKKDTGNRHLVSTWQSLKNNPEIIKNYQCVIVDECHMAKGPILQELLLKFGKNIPIRFGVTGTMPKEDIDCMTVNMALGYELIEIPASDLIDKGFLSDLDIEIFELEHDLTPAYNNYIENFRKSLTEPTPVTYKKFRDTYLPDYASEKKYNNNCTEHMTWIAQKMEEMRDAHGNVLCLVDGVKYGKDLAEMIEGAIFLSGKDKIKDREAIYEQYAHRNDIILIATSQIASTGLNIKRIFTLMYINFGKSGIKTIQSIGRGLRMDTDKNRVKVLDITNDLKYGRKHTRERTNFYIEAKYPHKKKTVKFRGLDEKIFD